MSSDHAEEVKLTRRLRSRRCAADLTVLQSDVGGDFGLFASLTLSSRRGHRCRTLWVCMRESDPRLCSDNTVHPSSVIVWSPRTGGGTQETVVLI